VHAEADVVEGVGRAVSAGALHDRAETRHGL
jgi:hypothetical protein